MKSPDSPSSYGKKTGRPSSWWHSTRTGSGEGSVRRWYLLTLTRGFYRPGVGRIRLIVRKNNFRAQALYMSLHFTRTGEITKEVQGVPVDFFTMEITREDFYKGEESMKQALLVIDVQNEYFTGALPVTYPAGSLENITKAMDHANRSQVPVVVIQHTNPAPDAPAFRKGTQGWELHDEIKQRHADVVIEKTLPGQFHRHRPWRVAEGKQDRRRLRLPDT